MCVLFTDAYLTYTVATTRWNSIIIILIIYMRKLRHRQAKYIPKPHSWYVIESRLKYRWPVSKICFLNHHYHIDSIYFSLFILVVKIRLPKDPSNWYSVDHIYVDHIHGSQKTSGPVITKPLNSVHWGNNNSSRRNQGITKKTKWEAKKQQTSCHNDLQGNYYLPHFKDEEIEAWVYIIMLYFYSELTDCMG